MIANLLIALVLVSLLVCQLEAIRWPSSASRWIALRGGAKSRSSKVSSGARTKGSKGRKRSQYDDEDEDNNEDDDDYEEDRIPFSGKSKSRGKGGNKKMQLIPWGSGGGGKGTNKKKGFFNFKDKLESITKVGQSLTKDSYRRLKVLRSSSFEGILLKATWPGNDPVPPELLTEIV
eukprot:gene33245-40221_t